MEWLLWETGEHAEQRRSVDNHSWGASLRWMSLSERPSLPCCGPASCESLGWSMLCSASITKIANCLPVGIVISLVCRSDWFVRHRFPLNICQKNELVRGYAKKKKKKVIAKVPWPVCVYEQNWKNNQNMRELREYVKRIKGGDKWIKLDWKRREATQHLPRSQSSSSLFRESREDLVAQKSKSHKTSRMLEKWFIACCSRLWPGWGS